MHRCILMVQIRDFITSMISSAKKADINPTQ
jgi:hypothetical protein